MKIGYARCSTVPQDTETQQKKLAALGVESKHVYIDHGFSGKTMSRDGLQHAVKALRSGDELVVPAMDRLARNARETLELVDQLTVAGVNLNIGGMLYEPNSPMSKLFITILAAVAEAEGGWISIRTKEAMARESVREKLKGRQSRLKPKDDANIARHHELGTLTVAELAEMYKLSRPAIYRALARHRERAAVASTPDTEAAS